MTEIQNPKQKKQSKVKIRNFMILKKANQLKKIFLSILEKSSLGHAQRRRLRRVLVFGI